MKNNVNSLLVGLAIGTAIGAAIGYLAGTEKKEEILDELNTIVNKVKDGFTATVNKYKAQKAGSPAEEAEVSE
jgi:gas vesicle protein